MGTLLLLVVGCLVIALLGGFVLVFVHSWWVLVGVILIEYLYIKFIMAHGYKL